MSFKPEYLMWAINMYEEIENMKTQDTVIFYQTRRNADMTEGRGPMVNDLAFLNYQDAADYIDTKSGVMGRRAKWSKEKYGEWDIQEVHALTGPFDAVADAKRKALAKLTEEERKILGLE